MTPAERLSSNYQNRRIMAGGRCEAKGLHHPDCPGDGNVLHHRIRRSDPWPDGVQCRNDFEMLLWVWNGPSTLGRGGCHEMIHSNVETARTLGYLVPGF